MLFDKKKESLKVFNINASENFYQNFVSGLVERVKENSLQNNSSFLREIKIFTIDYSTTQLIKKKLSDTLLKNYVNVHPLDDLSLLMSDEYQKKNLLKKKNLRIISQNESLYLISNFLKEFLSDFLNDYRTHFYQSSMFEISYSILNLFDELDNANVTCKELKKINIDTLSYFEKKNLFLILNILKKMENYKFKKKLISKYENFKLDLNSVQEFLKKKKYNNVVLIVGSTGTRLATSEFMKEVLNLPQGAVVFPGFDNNFPYNLGLEIGKDHPQHSFFSLLKHLNLNDLKSQNPFKLNYWNLKKTEEKSLEDIRRDFMFLSLYPVQYIDYWINKKKFVSENAERIFENFSLIEVYNQSLEAKSICNIIVKNLKENKSISLITSSKFLTKRVISELKRWNINPKNLHQKKTFETREGVLILTIAKLINNLNFQELINVLKISSKYFDYSETEILYISMLEKCPYNTGSYFSFHKERYDWVEKQEEQFLRWFIKLNDFCQRIKIFNSFHSLKTHVDNHLSLLDFFSNNKFIKNQCDINDDLNLIIKKTLNVIKNYNYNKRKYRSDEYYELLKIFFKIEDVVDETYHNDSIIIMSPMDSRNFNSDINILSDLNEDSWPPNLSNNIWFSKKIRNKLGLDFNERKIGISANDFLQSLFAEKVFLTRSKKNHLESSIPSRWLTRMEALLKGSGEKGINTYDQVKRRGEKYIFFQHHEDIKRTFTNINLRPAPIVPIKLLPKKISVSKIDNLIRDPYAFYVSEILKIKKINNFPIRENYKLRGIIIHKVLEEFIIKFSENNYSEFQSIKVFNSILEKKLLSINLTKDIMYVWFSKFKKTSKFFIKNEIKKRDILNKIQAETFGNLNLILDNGLELNIVCKADRIDSSNTEIIIYDYKTSFMRNIDLMNLSPQLDIEALILKEKGFKKISSIKNKNILVSIISFNANAKEIKKLIKEKDFSIIMKSLKNILKHFYSGKNPFVSKLILNTNKNYGGDYDHLSRYGEWDGSSNYKVTNLIELDKNELKKK